MCYNLERFLDDAMITNWLVWNRCTFRKFIWSFYLCFNFNCASILIYPYWVTIRPLFFPIWHFNLKKVTNSLEVSKCHLVRFKPCLFTFWNLKLVFDFGVTHWFSSFITEVRDTLLQSPSIRTLKRQRKSCRSLKLSLIGIW